MRAPSRAAFDHAHGFQRDQRLANRRAGNLQTVAQIGLVYAVARHQQARLHPRQNILAHLIRLCPHSC